MKGSKYEKCKLCGHGVRDYAHIRSLEHKKHLFEIMQKKEDNDWVFYFEKKILHIR